MADSSDIDLEDGDAPAPEGGSAKKTSGLAALLPNLLKFVAIGLGALIFIVTVVIITVNLMSGGGKSQTAAAQPASAYAADTKTYSYSKIIGMVRTQTSDGKHMVSVDLAMGYDENDKNIASELTARQYELKDFVRNFFKNKSASELENEERIKTEILENINTRILTKSKIRKVTFDQLDVTEM
ncbi:hypothetical protein FACS1894151_06340 [Spirochaetia bacterium]|nr:hypothetical protein FACS1894151_06340 [Spirochaetia bacterium]